MTMETPIFLPDTPNGFLSHRGIPLNHRVVHGIFHVKNIQRFFFVGYPRAFRAGTSPSEYPVAGLGTSFIIPYIGDNIMPTDFQLFLKATIFFYHASLTLLLITIKNIFSWMRPGATPPWLPSWNPQPAMTTPSAEPCRTWHSWACQEWTDSWDTSLRPKTSSWPSFGDLDLLVSSWTPISLGV